MEVQTEPTQRKKTAPKKKVSTGKAFHPPAVQKVTPPAPTSMLQVIATAVADPRCDVAKMQALLDMQKQIEEREERKAFTVAFNNLQAELPVISRDGKIDHGVDGSDRTRSGKKALKTSYATWPNLNRVVGPLLKKHGFTFSSSVEPAPDGTMFVISTLEHVLGHSRPTRFKLGADTTGGKNNQQGWGSSQQYGMRYNMIALLNIVSEAPQDADRDGFDKDAPPATITANQVQEITRLLKDAGASEEKFCTAMEVDSIAMLPPKDFDLAKTRIANYKKAKQAAASDFPGDRR